MGYKDKQREANKQASQRRRDKQKGMTQQIHKRGTVDIINPASVIPKRHTRQATEALDIKLGGVIYHTPDIENFGQPDCQCKHCQQNRAQGSRHVINHGPYKTEQQLEDRELNRVALPGDADYTGCQPAATLLVGGLPV